MTEKDIFSFLFYLAGSCFGLYLIVYFTFYGDLEYLSIKWEILQYLSDEWRLLITLLLFSFGVYCFLKLQHEIKKLNKPTLDWWQKGVVYQIYPKSFKDTTGNGVGDLRGIIEKLDYLKTIGIDILWLNPIYPSGGKDNGYDVTSYVDIDKLYGGMKNFDELVTSVHDKGMFLVMDFVPNHTSSLHEWFVKSCSNDDKYKDYYIWYPSNDRSKPPNNWINIVGNSAWTYNEKRKAWYLHTFLPDQPDLNMRSPGVREEMKTIIKFWLEEKKVNGLRIDALKHLFKDPKFPNEPENTRFKSGNRKDSEPYDKLEHKYTTGLPETFEILAEWRELADEIGKRMHSTKLIFVECYGVPNEQIRYINCNDKPGCHFPLNFQLLNLCENENCSLPNIRQPTEFKPHALKEIVDEWTKLRDTKHFWSNWELGNHDVTRVGTRIYAENIKLANALALLLGGTPFTYYGEELGMEDLDHGSITFEQCQDEFGKTLGPDGYRKYNRDYVRSPMQWDRTANSGFSGSGVKPWLPVNKNYLKINTEEQLKNPSSPLRIYMDLVKLRQNDSFLWGSFRYAIVDEHIFSFVRSAFDYSTFLVAMNLTDEDVSVNFFTTKLVPYTVNVAYYFDNHTNTALDRSSESQQAPIYTLNQQMTTKNVILKAKSCVILSWKST